MLAAFAEAHMSAGVDAVRREQLLGQGIVVSPGRTTRSSVRRPPGPRQHQHQQE